MTRNRFAQASRGRYLTSKFPHVSYKYRKTGIAVRCRHCSLSRSHQPSMCSRIHVLHAHTLTHSLSTRAPHAQPMRPNHFVRVKANYYCPVFCAKTIETGRAVQSPVQPTTQPQPQPADHLLRVCDIVHCIRILSLDSLASVARGMSTRTTSTRHTELPSDGSAHGSESIVGSISNGRRPLSATPIPARP